MTSLHEIIDVELSGQSTDEIVSRGNAIVIEDVNYPKTLKGNMNEHILNECYIQAEKIMKSNNVRIDRTYVEAGTVRKFYFSDLVVGPDFKLKGILTFTPHQVDIEVGLANREFNNIQETMTAIESLRKRNQGLKMGALFANYEENRIETYISHRFRQANHQYLASIEFIEVLKILFSTSFFLFKNNLNLFQSILNPLQFLQKITFDDNQYDGNSDPIVQVDDSIRHRVDKIKKVLEEHYKGPESDQYKVVEKIEVIEGIDEPKQIGYGGFNVAYSRLFRCSVSNGKKKEIKTLKLVFKKPREKKNKDDPQNPEVDPDKQAPMASNSKKIGKRDQYLKKKNEHEIQLITKKIAHIHSKNIVKHYIHQPDKTKDPEIYLERCPYSDLHSYLAHTKVLTITTKCLLAIGAAEGIEALHTNNIVHKDMKPQNVFISNGLTPKIGDFGESCEFSNKTKGRKKNMFIPLGSTPYYDPPEVREKKCSKEELQKIFGPPVDIYAYGLILAELFFDITPKTIDYKTVMKKKEQQEKITEEMRKRVINERDLLNIVYYPRIIEIIQNCLSEDPLQRWSITYIKSRLQFLLAHYQTMLS